MFASLEYVMECALEHPILEERRKELAVVPPSKDTFENRTAITAMHAFHHGNVLAPLTQIDKIEVYSRLLNNEVLQYRSQVPLFGETNRNQSRGATGIMRSSAPFVAPSIGHSERLTSVAPSTPPQTGRSTDNTLPSEEPLYDDEFAEEEEEDGERHSIILDDEDDDNVAE